MDKMGMMEVNNLGLQTELKPMAQDEFETMLGTLATNVQDMREALASIGMTTLACSSKSCNLTNLDSNMPDVCILDVMDWTDELAHDHTDKPSTIKSRARQLDSTFEMIARKVEPIANAPYGRHDLPFLVRGLAHPRVQASLGELHSALSKIANYETKAVEKIAA